MVDIVLSTDMKVGVFQDIVYGLCPVARLRCWSGSEC
jgi:hypothetical protein